MSNADNKIMDFLNINEEQLSLVDSVTYAKMVLAVNTDEYFELHKLGYFVPLEIQVPELVEVPIPDKIENPPF